MTLYVSIVNNIDRRCFWSRISPPTRVWQKFIFVVSFTVAAGLSNAKINRDQAAFYVYC